jgi:hypothetical protein
MWMCRPGLTIVLLLLVVSPAAAADPARDLAAMRVNADAVIHVRTTNGVELTGRFVRASTQALVMTGRDGRETSLDAGQVLLVWRDGDSVRNGAIIGGLVGLAGGILGKSNCTDCSAERAVGVALGVPIWAGIGALIDRQRTGRTLIYRAP